MKIALLQMQSSMAVKDNLSAFLAYGIDAVRGGADYIFTPECSNVMALGRDVILPLTCAEQDDPFLKAVQAFARDHSVTIFLGSIIVKIADDRLANRSLVVGSDGQIQARYDKIHLFDVDLGGGESYRESALYQAGDQAVMISLPETDISVGLSVCYDVRFPYLYRDYATKGAKILTVPAAFTVPTGQAHWHVLLRARAIETGSFVIASAQSGMHETGRATYGHSLVVDPWGQVLLDAGGSAESPNLGAHLCTLDLDAVAKARQKIPSLQHSRSL